MFGSSSLSFLLEVVTPNEMELGEYDITLGPRAFGFEQQVVNVYRAPYGSGVESYRLETLLVEMVILCGNWPRELETVILRRRSRQC